MDPRFGSAVDRSTRSSRRPATCAAMLMAFPGMIVLVSCSVSATSSRTDLAEIRDVGKAEKLAKIRELAEGQDIAEDWVRIDGWSGPPQAGSARGTCSVRKENGRFKLSISATSSCTTSFGLEVTVFDEHKHRLLENEHHDEVVQPEPPTTFWTGLFERTSSGYGFDVLLTARCAGSVDGGAATKAYGHFSCRY